MIPQQAFLLEIETAKARHAWAKMELLRGGTSPSLKRYAKESLDEWRALKAMERYVVAPPTPTKVPS